MLSFVLYCHLKGGEAVARSSDAGRPAYGSPERGEYFQRTIYFTREISDRLDKYCTDDERAASWVVRKALDKWLTEKGY